LELIGSPAPAELRISLSVKPHGLVHDAILRSSGNKFPIREMLIDLSYLKRVAVPLL
jgi:hypothetical protein